MSTVLYDIKNKTVLGKFDPYYIVDGKRPILTDDIIELNIIETPQPQIENNQILTIDWRIEGENYVKVYLVRDKTEEELLQEKIDNTPKEITKRQLLLFLYAYMNITNDDILSIINQLDNQIQRDLLRIEWESATVVNRTLPHVIAFSSILGITEEQLAEIYYQAKDI